MNIKHRFDNRTIARKADDYFRDQCRRLGPVDHEVRFVFVPVPVTPKRNRRKRVKGE